MNFLRFSLEKQLINLGHGIKKLQTEKTMLPTCRSFEYKTNAIWTSQNGIEMNILWIKQIQWQFGNLLKTYFESEYCVTSSKSESVFLNLRFGLWVRSLKTRGALLQKIAAEGVSFIWGRWIASEWPRLDRGWGRGAGRPELDGRGGAMANVGRSWPCRG